MIATELLRSRNCGNRAYTPTSGAALTRVPSSRWQLVQRSSPPTLCGRLSGVAASSARPRRIDAPRGPAGISESAGAYNRTIPALAAVVSRPRTTWSLVRAMSQAARMTAAVRNVRRRRPAIGPSRCAGGTAHQRAAALNGVSPGPFAQAVRTSLGGRSLAESVAYWGRVIGRGRLCGRLSPPSPPPSTQGRTGRGGVMSSVS
jgi:hypothetical protein